MISHLRPGCAISADKSSLRRPLPFTTNILVWDSDVRPPSPPNLTLQWEVLFDAPLSPVFLLRLPTAISNPFRLFQHLASSHFSICLCLEGVVNSFHRVHCLRCTKSIISCLDVFDSLSPFKHSLPFSPTERLAATCTSRLGESKCRRLKRRGS